MNMNSPADIILVIIAIQLVFIHTLQLIAVVSKIVSNKIVSNKVVSNKVFQISHKLISNKVISHKAISHKVISHKVISHKVISHKVISHKMIVTNKNKIVLVFKMIMMIMKGKKKIENLLIQPIKYILHMKT